MRITRFAQSCILIETNRKKLEIINPIKKPKKIPRHLEQKKFSNPKKGILRSFFL